MRVLFIAGREPGYTRNRVILKGLRENGVDVIECASSYGSYPARYLQAFWKWAASALARERYDAIFAGYLSQPIVPVIRSLKPRKPIVFDAFISLYDTLVFDRRAFTPGSPVGRLSRSLDRWSCRLADMVLLDTDEHIRYFTDELECDARAFRKLYVGADDNFFYPREGVTEEGFTVYFQASTKGLLLPLHGLEYILESARLLEGEKDIRFRIIADVGPDVRASKKNVLFMEHVPYARLPELVASSSVCLGAFGSTNKARRVIPTKVFEAIAMGKPLISARTPAINELFEDRKNIFLCEPADPRSLADAILLLKSDGELRESIGRGGYELFRRECTPAIIGGQVKDVIEGLL